MYILGISFYFTTDAAAVLLKDGALVAARKKSASRAKNTTSIFPNRLSNSAWKRRASPARISTTSCFSRSRSAAGPHPDDGSADLSKVLEGVPRIHDHWMIDKLWVATTLQTELGISKDKILFSEHHLSHAASAYLCSPFEESRFLRWMASVNGSRPPHGMGKGNQLTLNKQIEFPHSLGLLYSAFTAFLGFEVNEGGVQSKWHGPIWRSHLRGQGLEVDSVEQRRIFLAEHGLLQLPPFHREDLQQ